MATAGTLPIVDCQHKPSFRPDHRYCSWIIAATGRAKGSHLRRDSIWTQRPRTTGSSRGFTPKQIVIHGESLGTAVATYLATNRGSAGVILEAPFTSAKAVAGRVVPFVGPLFVHGYDSMKRIKDIHVPLLIIHGDRDEVIAYQFGQELFRAANEPKSFWTIAGATHNDLHIRGRAEFPARLRSFYRSLRSK